MSEPHLVMTERRERREGVEYRARCLVCSYLGEWRDLNLAQMDARTHRRETAEA